MTWSPQQIKLLRKFHLEFQDKKEIRKEEEIRVNERYDDMLFLVDFERKKYKQVASTPTLSSLTVTL